MEGGETPKKTGIGRFLDARARARPCSGRPKPWPGLLFVPRDLFLPLVALLRFQGHGRDGASLQPREGDRLSRHFAIAIFTFVDARSEEHTSELQSLMRITYAVFCLKKKRKIRRQ